MNRLLYAVQLTIVSACCITTTTGLRSDHFYPDDGKHDGARLLYQYPVGSFIENIAVRSNGKLLVTLLNQPHLDQINPFDKDPQPETMVRFPDAQSASGIAEIDHDVFATAVGNFSFGGRDSNPPGSWSIWHVAFDTASESGASADRLTTLPEVRFANGLCNLPKTAVSKDILVGDVYSGKIWRVRSQTGAREVVIENNLTAVVPDPVYGGAGVNGKLVVDDTLYFANTGANTFARMRITPDGLPAGPPELVAKFVLPTQADDFDIRGEYAYFATGSDNTIVRLGLSDGGSLKVIAGHLNSTGIAQPTSVAFGRTTKDRHVLYVVTGGGLGIPVNGNKTVGAQVLAVDTRRLW